MDIGFLVTIIVNVYATYSISQIYFQSLSYCDLVLSLIWLGDITDLKKLISLFDFEQVNHQFKWMILLFEKVISPI